MNPNEWDKSFSCMAHFVYVYIWAIFAMKRQHNISKKKLIYILFGRRLQPLHSFIGSRQHIKVKTLNSIQKRIQCWAFHSFSNCHLIFWYYVAFVSQNVFFSCSTGIFFFFARLHFIFIFMRIAKISLFILKETVTTKERRNETEQWSHSMNRQNVPNEQKLNVFEIRIT